MEESIQIKSESGFLEAIIDRQSTTNGVVITHPHSLYGGNMDNAVVRIISSVYKVKGFTTLRFNFRGVGGSTGTYDEGFGEQKDIESAINYLLQLGIKRIDLSGYSFGSWVIFNLVSEKELSNKITFVSPPIDFISFKENQSLTNLTAVVVGDRDEFSSIDHLQSVLSEWNNNAQLKIVDGADHFFSGKSNELARVLQESI